jgi:CheY-like chemotaxis protein/anti-sigma regulatory factor (Ser/Thr protein kinase)
MLGIVRASAQSLVGIINDVLDLARLEVGRVELDARPFDLRACIEESLDTLAAAAAQKGVELACIADDATPARLEGDAARVRQVLLNLLGNAVKFTQRGHIVATLSSRLLSDGRCEAHIAVSDTGPGIPPDRLEAIFGEYVQGDATTAAQHGGSGLGLSIARRLAGMMGGQLWAESVVRAGSTFHFTLVARAPDATASATPAAHPALRGARIAIAHNSETIGRALAARVERWGAHAWFTTRAAAVVEHLRAGEPCDLLVLDQQVGGMGGRALAAAVRQLPAPAPAAVPLVLLTSLDKAERDTGGADTRVRFAAYVAKPVKEAKLHEALVTSLTVPGLEAPPIAAGEAPAPPPSPRNTRLSGTRVLVARRRPAGERRPGRAAARRRDAGPGRLRRVPPSQGRSAHAARARGPRYGTSR